MLNNLNKKEAIALKQIGANKHHIEGVMQYLIRQLEEVNCAGNNAENPNEAFRYAVAGKTLRDLIDIFGSAFTR
jgi:hypothetical protein